LIEERVKVWTNAIENPPKPVEPTKEELEKAKLELEESLAKISADIAAKEEK
jgi:hypothetical protein